MISVRAHLDGIENLFKNSNKERVNKELCERVLTDSSKFVPVDTTTLYQSGRVDGTDMVVWDTSYAKTVYNMDDGGTNWTSPNTLGTEPHSHWFEKAKQEHLKDWEKCVMESIK